MRTSDLVDLLAADDHAVHSTRWTILPASVIALLIALMLTIALLEVRPAIVLGSPVVAAKLMFTFSLALLAWPALWRLLRPGAVLGWSALLPILPAVAVVSAAIIQMTIAPVGVWRPETPSCLVLIPLFGLPGLVVIMRAARRQAPTDLTRAGFFAGLVAGGLSASAYALQCPNDDPVYLAAWYLPAIVITGLIGRTLGTRLLAW